MPVRYDIAAGVPQASGSGIDPLNMMAALRQQEYQDAQLAALQQRGVYQDQQAQMAAMREARQAAAEQARQGQLELETRLKHLEHVRQLAPLVTPQNYPAFVSEVTGRFPEMKPLFPAAYDPETMQKFSLSAEKFYTQFGPREVDTVRDGVPGKEQQRFDFASKSYVPVPGSFAPSKPDVQYDAATSTLIDKTSGTARPVMMGGAPAAATATVAAAPAAMPAPGFNMDAAKAGISKVESGGNYSALGPETKKGDRAYGKYQVMGANIPAWTKQALGQSLTPEQFLKSPEAQEAVFEDQFRRNVAKYGTVQDAASVWFSGRPMAKAGNARDVLGTTVPDYVNKFMAGYQGGVKNAMVQPMTGEAPSLRNVPVDAFAAPAMPPAPIMPMSPVGPQPTQPARPQTLADYAGTEAERAAQKKAAEKKAESDDAARVQQEYEKTQFRPAAMDYVSAVQKAIDAGAIGPLQGNNAWRSVTASSEREGLRQRVEQAGKRMAFELAKRASGGKLDSKGLTDTELEQYFKQLVPLYAQDPQGMLDAFKTNYGLSESRAAPSNRPSLDEIFK